MDPHRLEWGPASRHSGFQIAKTSRRFQVARYRVLANPEAVIVPHFCALRRLMVMVMVMVIDDDADIRTAIQELLDEDGFATVAFLLADAKASRCRSSVTLPGGRRRPRSRALNQKPASIVSFSSRWQPQDPIPNRQAAKVPPFQSAATALCSRHVPVAEHFGPGVGAYPCAAHPKREQKPDSGSQKLSENGSRGSRLLVSDRFRQVPGETFMSSRPLASEGLVGTHTATRFEWSGRSGRPTACGAPESVPRPAARHA